MVSDVPGPWIRRPVSTLILVLATIATLLIAPLAITAAAILDVATSTPRWRRTRGVTLIAALILIDFVGRTMVFGSWLIAPLGFRVRSPLSLIHI